MKIVKTNDNGFVVEIEFETQNERDAKDRYEELLDTGYGVLDAAEILDGEYNLDEDFRNYIRDNYSSFSEWKQRVQ